MSGELNPALDDGLRQLSGARQVPFVQYIRHVLPLDGYIFWLRTRETTFFGSLHVSIFEQQNPDETIAINRVTFQTSTPIDALNDIAPNEMWVGEIAGIRFAFSQLGPFYENAGIYHYGGEAVYPAMETQLVDVGSQLSDQTLVVSNSLPAWLTIQGYGPIWLDPPNPGVTLYPSFAVPANLRPPYGAVHIEPARTRPLQGAPSLSWHHSTHRQLATDHVVVTLYGLTNDQALDWLDTVNRYSYDYNIIGMMAPTIMRDEKRAQVGLNLLAMKKTVEFDVSYIQTRVNDIARQLVEATAATVIPRDFAIA